MTEKGSVPRATTDAAGPWFRAVVFDLDGVLVESEHLWERCWTSFAAQRGVHWTPEHTAKVQGMSAPEWAAVLADVVGSGEDPAAVERLVVDEMVAALHAGEIELLPGARRMIEQVCAHAPIALASSAPRRLIDAVLQGHEMAADFTATVSSAEVARGKPSPDVYSEAIARLGVPAERGLAVEDSSNGIRAASAAGLTVVAHPNALYPLAADAHQAAVMVASDVDAVREYLVAELSAVSDTEAKGA